MIAIETKTSWWRYVAIAAGVFVLLYLFCGKDVSGTGDGADKIRNEIATAGQNADKLTERLDDIEAGTHTVTGRIEESQRTLSSASNRVERIEENVSNAKAINRECQSILQAIRRRGEAEGENN